ncbi:glycosyl hydrolase family 95 catalytic domain-containing protein [Mucilaginibacter sp. SP1R1]|uniref:glycoside hydrolase family 95 protein n=1 Tax=Mucilaginibacter sp. SP1R1 TaxID=2723091 RepID=UPI001612B94A|nr:glycoside hydrolase family 95 protein [Mucilaginibacter sp. SP1R1]MBB6149670.1 alpha-L-fucosidase 2 [Mucilaginibacter sp. SP1R1]
MITKNFVSVTAMLLCISTLGFSQKQPLRLHYDKPASIWEETLPLGNGRLGMMPDGGVTNEKIVLNDITLWSGSPQDANNYDAYKKLPEIKQLLLAGKNVEAQALIDKDFVCKGPGSGGAQWGCYQLLGDLDLKFDYKEVDGAPVKFTNYQRELSLNKAVAGCSYEVNGVTYKREYFTSFGDDVDMIRLTADKPGQLNFSINLSRPERSVTNTADNTLQMQGRLDNGTDGNGMQYLANVKARLTGGSLTKTANSLIVKNATEVIIYIAAATDFKNADFKQKVKQDLASAMKKSYALQKQEHIANYQKLFNRVDINLGATGENQETTDQQLISFHKEPIKNKDLPVLFFQFGRYLSISSTRVGLLPPNLQGLWANQTHTPWNGDYHLDVNVQMNHFPVEVANLSELNLPLVELVRGLVKNGERTAKAYYNADGWVAHVITNVWGWTEPGESASWGVTKAGSGWLCSNIWDHYAFTNDKAYLKSIYPILKGSAQFYSSILVKDPKTGWMVTAPSSSPENSFYLPDGSHASICIGATIDNQIMRELFANVITASETLGTDAAFRDTLKLRLKQIPPAGVINKDGRIQEWLEDYKETELQHRHISHLYGIYPASLITPDGTPELAEAAKKTLNVRGDDGPSWSIAYKLLFWARLHDGNRAYKLFTEIMKPTFKTDINYGAGGGIYPNLLSAGPPFQIDGNFGTTAGIAEMLIQSHAGYIDLLPAIPDSWQASGEVKGLKARGNFTVDFKWKDGKVTSYKITSTTPGKVKVKVNGVIKMVIVQKA